MATFDIGKAYQEALAFLEAETVRVTEARASKANTEQSKARQGLRNTLAQADLLDLSKTERESLQAKLDKINVAEGIDTTAADMAATSLANMVGIPGALTNAQALKATAAVKAYQEAKPRRGGRGSGAATLQAYVTGPVALLDQWGNTFAVEQSSTASVVHTLRKATRIAQGLDRKASHPVDTKAVLKALVEQWGTRPGKDGAPSIDPATTLGQRIPVTLQGIKFTLERVSAVTTGHGGLGALEQRYQEASSKAASKAPKATKANGASKATKAS